MSSRLNPFSLSGAGMGLLRGIQEAGIRAVEHSKPTDVTYGVVATVDPLSIEVDENLTLEEDQLHLSRELTDYWLEMTVDHKTELESEHTHPGTTLTVAGTATPGALTVTGSATGDTTSGTPHLHDYVGRKRFRVHNKLLVGERVAMLRHAGGQTYFVFARLELEE